MLKVVIKQKDLKELIAFAKNGDKTANDIIVKSLNEIGNRFLIGVKKRTPTGDYKPIKIGNKIYNVGKVGGTLKNSWFATGTKGSNGAYINRIYNSIGYAEYVEFGHRQTPGRFVPHIGKKLVANFVEGKFMLTKTYKEFEDKDIISNVFLKHIEEAKWFKK